MDHSANPTAPARAVAVWLGLLTLYLVWGSTYLGLRFAVETIPPYIMGSLRFGIAGAAMLLWSIARNPGDRPSLREVRDSSIVGTVLLGGGMGLVAVGEQTIPSGIAALLIGLMPAWLVVFGRVFVGERISRPVGIGILVGIAGVAILAAPWESTGRLDTFGLAAILASPIIWALGSIFSAHRAVEPSDPIRAIAIQMLAGALAMAVVAAVVGDLARFDPAAISDRSLLALAYLTTIGSVVAYSTYIWLLRHAPLAKVGTYAYVNPVVAFVLGAWLANEPVTLRTVAAGAIILFAVTLIVTARGRMAGSGAAGRRRSATEGERPVGAGRTTAPGIASSP